jgi:hypothetical protein
MDIPQAKENPEDAKRYVDALPSTVHHALGVHTGCLAGLCTRIETDSGSDDEVRIEIKSHFRNPKILFPVPVAGCPLSGECRPRFGIIERPTAQAGFERLTHNKGQTKIETNNSGFHLAER